MRELRTVLRELHQQIEIAVYERLLLRPAPALELTFGGDGIGNAVEILRISQFDGTPRLCKAAIDAGVVFTHPLIQAAARGADMVPAVATA